MSAFKQNMRKLGVRAGLLAGTSLAVVAIAGVGASSASAACTTSMKGQGSSLQKIAQLNVWAPGYKAEGCPGGEAEALYTSSSSGKGLAAWGFSGSGKVETEWTYVGTDDGPNSGQITNARTAAGGTANVVVVPVAQTAIAIMVNLPANCTLGSIKNQALEEAFSGAATTWSAIGGSGAGCSATFKRVVRAEGSGTTYQFKNYLALINKSKNSGTEKEVCASDTRKWSELEEIGTGEKPNTEWPTACGASTVETAAGGGALAAKVAGTVNTIGYASLPDAKANSAKVIKVQNNGTSNSGAFPATPFVEGPLGETLEEANCANAEYNVPAAGNKSLSGTGLNVDWSKVFGGSPSIGGTTYPLCTLTYDLGWNKYTQAGFGGTIGTAVKDFFKYILEKKFGAGTNKNYSQVLPAKTGASEEHNVQAAAEFALEKVE
jgi:ABC-type phosphate transport system substrate-binding protein